MLEATDRRGCADEIAAVAGLMRYRAAPPEAMVPAAEARALHQAVRAVLGPERGAAVLRAAGDGTGRYLLAHRIPARVQTLLRLLPAPLAARALVAAIRRHAWTFGVPGGFGVEWRGGLRLSLAANPLCAPGDAARPACDFYAATFETLFRNLVGTRLHVAETACIAQGDPACIFAIAPLIRDRP